MVTDGGVLSTIPSPVSGTLKIGISVSLEEILTVAAFAPPEAGVNTTAMVHKDEPGITVVVQLLVWLNSPAFAPKRLIELIIRSAVPVFETAII